MPSGPCPVLAQLSHMPIPSSGKDSLIPTEFQADKSGASEMLFIFFSCYPDWLASSEGEGEQMSQEAGPSCGTWGERRERPSEG